MRPILDEVVSQLGLDPTQPQGEALKKVFQALSAGALTGVGARAAIGMARPDYDYQLPKQPKPLTVVIPRPEPVPEMKQLKFSHEQETKTVTKVAHDIADWLSRQNYLPDVGAANFLKDYRLLEHAPISGSKAQRATDVPWWLLGVTAGLPVGFAGGYKALDAVIHSKNKSDADAAISRERDRYQSELLHRMRGYKSAAEVDVNKLDEVIDALTDAYESTVKAAAKFEKKAEPDNVADDFNLATRLMFPGTNLGPTAANLNLLLSGTLAGLGGYLGYSSTRSPDIGNYKAKQIRDMEEDSMYQAPPIVVAKFVDQEKPKSKLQSLLSPKHLSIR